MNNKKFISFVLKSSCLVLITIALFNFIIDPGEVYLKKILGNIKANEFSEKLFNSNNGIVQSGWNERLIKTTLAKSSEKFDCVVMGSSHIMQISSIRNTGNINTQCSNLLNLGVSGGSIEDIAIFSYIILNENKLPNKIYIDIAPWLFKFDMEVRSQEYINYYNLLNQTLSISSDSSNDYYWKLIKNLFNLEYFHKSIDEFKKTSIENMFYLRKKEIYPDTIFSYNQGYKEPVTLADGSHLYDSGFIGKAKKDILNIENGGGDYKISGNIYDKEALKLFEKLILFYQKKDIEVNFILTPYHPNVFKSGETKPVKHMREIEKLAKILANQHHINLYGSFFPENLGCKENEFFDFMHATSDCLDRLGFDKKLN